LSKTSESANNGRRATSEIIDGGESSIDNGFAQLLEVAVKARVPPGPRDRIDGVVVGTIIGFAEDGLVPLVIYHDQPGTAALSARTTLDLYARHVGSSVVLVFEDGDPDRPIIMGCLRANAKALPDVAGQIEVETDGQRLIVTAKDQMVLRCGKASITLTKEGKVILQGAYVSSQSSGVLRIKGGSVQIN
jgi:uncharacterized protein DUF6484